MTRHATQAGNAAYAPPVCRMRSSRRLPVPRQSRPFWVAALALLNT